MKTPAIPQILLQAVLLFLTCTPVIDAIAETDSKERQAVHHLQLQLRAAQHEKAELAGQVEALKKQLGELESKRAALEKKLSGQSREISELSGKQKQDELSSKQHQAELSDKYNQMEQQYKTASSSLQQLQMEKEQEEKRLDGEIRVCGKKNSELYLLSVELMDKYQAKGVLDAMLQAEPFTQLEKVRVENLLQEFRDKADANRISSLGNDAQVAGHP